MAADLSSSIAQLLRAVVVAFIIIQFLRRIFKAGAQAKGPTGQSLPARRDRSQSRNEPPPPENPFGLK